MSQINEKQIQKKRDRAHRKKGQIKNEKNEKSLSLD